MILSFTTILIPSDHPPVFCYSVGFLTFKLFLWLSFFNEYLSNINLSFLKCGCQHWIAVIVSLQFHLFQ